MLQAVFAEYERQCWKRRNGTVPQHTEDDYADFEDDELVAMQSFRVTAPSAKEARQRALQDEEFVRRMHTQETLSKSHSSLPDVADQPPRSMRRRGSMEKMGNDETLTYTDVSCSLAWPSDDVGCVPEDCPPDRTSTSLVPRAA